MDIVLERPIEIERTEKLSLPISVASRVNRERFLDAAEICFRQSGTSNTIMLDIARRAKSSRSTLYRYFKNREDILLCVIERESQRVAESIQARLSQMEDPGEYIVEGIIMTLLEVPKNPVLSLLFKPEMTSAISHLVLTSKRFSEIGLSLLLPVIEPARSRGLLRSSVQEEMLIEWILRIVMSHLLIPLHSESEVQEFKASLTLMLLPTILKD